MNAPVLQRGGLMIEVLITMVIAAFGLLGIAALQAKMQLAEMESYQRSHATILVRHIADRINANRKNAMAYVTSEPLGTDKGVRDCTGRERRRARSLRVEQSARRICRERGRTAARRDDRCARMRHQYRTDACRAGSRWPSCGKV